MSVLSGILLGQKLRALLSKSILARMTIPDLVPGWSLAFVLEVRPKASPPTRWFWPWSHQECWLLGREMAIPRAARPGAGWIWADAEAVCRAESLAPSGDLGSDSVADSSVQNGTVGRVRRIIPRVQSQ